MDDLDALNDKVTSFLKEMSIEDKKQPNTKTEKKCTKCKDKGFIDTGNNDLPCSCRKGDEAVFNTCNGTFTGKELKKREGY